MADWTKPFTASYVWRRVARDSYRMPPYGIGRETAEVTNITSARISVNSSTDTFESASAECVGMLDVGTDLVRCHLLATFADGTTEDVVLGTFEVTVPSRDVRGSFESCTATLDGRLIDLSEDSLLAPLSVRKGVNAQSMAITVAEQGGPTVAVPFPPSSVALDAQWTFGLTGNSEDEPGGSRLECVNALLEVANRRAAFTNEYGSIVIREPIDYDSTPVWEFVEGENATFLSEATEEFDTTNVANTVLAIYETSEATVVGVAIDDDPDSPYSTVNLGRRKVAKYTYNNLLSQDKANEVAAKLLATRQSVIRRVTIRHVWCGARVGDVVRIDYPSAGISGNFAIRTMDIDVGSAGCLCTTELRRFERG